MSNINTSISYSLRTLVVLNLFLLLGFVPPLREEASYRLEAWLIYSSVGVLVLAVFSFFTKADAPRRTGKIIDAIFAVAALLVLVFLSISSVPGL